MPLEQRLATAALRTSSICSASRKGRNQVIVKRANLKMETSPDSVQKTWDSSTPIRFASPPPAMAFRRIWRSSSPIIFAERSGRLPSTFEPPRELELHDLAPDNAAHIQQPLPSNLRRSMSFESLARVEAGSMRARKANLGAPALAPPHIDVTCLLETTDLEVRLSRLIIANDLNCSGLSTWKRDTAATSTSGFGLSFKPTQSRRSQHAARNEDSQPAAAETPELDQELEFQIPPEALQAALASSKDSDAAYYSFKLYQDPKGGNLSLRYCRNYYSTEAVASLFMDEKVLGFDIEWFSNAKSSDPAKKQVSLIQIASPSTIALFHVSLFRIDEPLKLLPPSLVKIITSKDIMKVGVNINGDCNRIHKYLGVKGQGLVELSHLHHLITGRYNQSGTIIRTCVALKHLTERYLLLPLKKDDVRTSDWTKPLNQEQCVYAATDAYASLRVFDILDRKRKLMEPTPDFPPFAELCLPIPGPVKPAQSSDAETSDPSETDENGDDDAEGPKHENLNNIDDHPSNGFEIAPYTSLGEANTPSGQDVAASSSSKNRHGAKKSQSAAPSSSDQSDAIRQAEIWIDAYCQLLPSHRANKPSVSRNSMRAYHLWHAQRMTVPEIAGELRSPPLALSTVATYILQCSRLEKLDLRQDGIEELYGAAPVFARRGSMLATSRKQ